MAEQRNSLFQRFTSWLLADPDAAEIDNHTAQMDLRQQVENAKNEWLAARFYFNNLTDPELIDYAIYTLEAAERKYMYLLKQLKSQEDS